MSIEDTFKSSLSLLASADHETAALRCGAGFAGNAFRLSYFGTEYAIALPEGSFAPDGLSIIEKVLIVHYLSSSGNRMAKGEWVSYKALEGGLFYYQACRKRGEGRLLGFFGDKPSTLFDAGKSLGAVRESLGDISFRIVVFPKIELLLVFHAGDDEFPAELSLLFKDDIQNYLSLDDIAVLSGAVAGRLIGAASGSF